MFVLVIMSHGAEDDVIYGTDGNSIKLADVYELIAPTSFPAMMDKVKLVIVQACGGGRVFQNNQILLQRIRDLVY